MSEPGPLPRGEHVALVVAIGARSTPANIALPVVTLTFEICEGAHRGRAFGIEVDLALPGGIDQLRAVARATGIDIGSETVLDTISGPVARAAAWAAVEGMLDDLRGRSLRITVWRLSDDHEPIATVWRALPVDVELFNSWIERTSRLPASNFSRIVGSHLAKIVGSELEEDGTCTKLILALALFKNRKRLDIVHLSFSIIHPNERFQYKNRWMVSRIGSAVGLREFDDAEMLHGTVFGITVWNDREFHLTPREATEDEKAEFEAAARTRWLWPSRRDFERNGGGGDAA